MTYRILEHTADVRLLVEGQTLEALFAEALRGMMELMQPETEPGEAEAQKRPLETSREIQVESPSATALLVDFLNEALSLAHSHRERYEGVEFKEISESRVHAELRGRAVPYFGEDIKAVTYHEADIRRNAAGNLETMLVFDI
jgi:SHS2 domain-containing protein